MNYFRGNMNKTTAYFLSVLSFLILMSGSARAQDNAAAQNDRWEVPDDTTAIRQMIELCQTDKGNALAREHLVLGKYYYHREEFARSINHLARAFAIAKEKGDNRMLAVICIYIGYNHFMNERETSLEYYQKALEYCHLAGDTLEESYVLSAIGSVYESWNDGATALEYYQKSLVIRERMGNADQRVSSILETARTYDRMGRFDQKKELLMKGMEIAEKDGRNEQNLIHLYQLMGHDLVGRHQDYKEALVYFLKAYDMAKRRNVYDRNDINTLRPVAETYQKLGDYKASAEYFKLYFDLLDENQKKMDKDLYESKSLLRKEVEKQELLQKDAEILRQRVEIQRQANLRNIFVAAIVVVLLFSFFIFRSYRMKQRQSAMLEEKVREKTAELQFSETRLREVNKELEAFIYKASHDLKGPLVSSRSLVSMVKEEKDPEETMKYIDMIQLSLTKLDNILMSLHEVAVIRQGDIEWAKVNIPYEISMLLKSFEGLPNFEKIQVSVDNKMQREFRTDKILMQTILRNIIENGIKYSRPDVAEPHIQVTIEEQGPLNVIRVSDNGIGIPMEHQGKIFDMFFRATENSKGSGLGLYIVKSALDKLKGRVEIESEPGKGTTFTLYFPQ